MNDDVNAFLEDVLPRMRSADTALHNGDPTGRIAMWSHGDPVTLFGAAFTATRWDEINRVFDSLGRSFSNCLSFDIEVVGGDVVRGVKRMSARSRATTSAAVMGGSVRPRTRRTRRCPTGRR